MKIRQQYYPALKDSMNLVWILFGLMIVCSIPQALIGRAPGNGMLSDVMTLITYCASVSGCIVIAMYRIKKHNKTYERLKWNKVSADIIVASIITGTCISTLCDPVISLLPMPDWLTKLFEELLHRNAVSFITACVAAPILEEILCRGIILNGLLRQYESRKAVILSALIFAFIHLNPWQGIIAFSLGLLLGWLYLRTRSILACIAVHFANNAETFFFGDVNLYHKLSPVLLVIVAGLLLCAGLYWINKRTPEYIPTQMPQEEDEFILPQEETGLADH